jgi:hypothetical protein
VFVTHFVTAFDLRLTVTGITPVPVAAQFKPSVSGRSPAEIVSSNPTGGMDVCR